MTSTAYILWITDGGTVKSPVLAASVVTRPGDEASGSGQWFASSTSLAGVIEEERRQHEHKLTVLLRRAATSCGLLPILFEESFRSRLRDPEPLCLVADTSAVLNGHLWHALHIRDRRPLHLVVPDQVFMEIQRQREREATKKDGESPWSKYLREREAASLLARSSRALQRAKASGHIIHYARPPAAMVRYFGSSLGKNNEWALDTPAVAPNYQRDRLILEALREQRSLLPRLQVWLLTGDVRLAGQAHLEDFRVGLGWLPPADDALTITSPRIDPTTFRVKHVLFNEFVNDLVWTFGRMIQQEHGEKRGAVFELPVSLRARTLLEISNQPTIRTCCDVELGVQPWPFGPSASADLRDAPTRPPGTANLINGLIFVGTDQTVNRYLEALGWIGDDHKSPTERGASLVERLGQVERDNVGAWFDWISDASGDFQRLKPIDSFLSAIKGRTQASATLIAKEAKMARATVEATGRLCHAFGLVLRVGGELWEVNTLTRHDAGQELLSVIHEAVAANDGAAVSSLDVFWSLTRRVPISFPLFRIALVDLVKAGIVEVGGSAPSSTTSRPASMSALDLGDSVTYVKVDLSAGDFVVPSHSSQIVGVPQ